MFRHPFTHSCHKEISDHPRNGRRLDLDRLRNVAGTVCHHRSHVDQTENAHRGSLLHSNLGRVVHLRRLCLSLHAPLYPLHKGLSNRSCMGGQRRQGESRCRCGGQGHELHAGNRSSKKINSPDLAHPPFPLRICRKSVHGSTSSPRRDYGTLKINYLAVRPEPFDSPFALSLSKGNGLLRTGVSKGERLIATRSLWGESHRDGGICVKLF
jgi:hypothetical protein